MKFLIYIEGFEWCIMMREFDVCFLCMCRNIVIGLSIILMVWNYFIIWNLEIDRSKCICLLYWFWYDIDLVNLLNFKFLFVFMDIYVYGIFWKVWYIEYNDCLLEVYNINNLNC